MNNKSLVNSNLMISNHSKNTAKLKGVASGQSSANSNRKGSEDVKLVRQSASDTPREKKEQPVPFNPFNTSIP